MARKKIAVVPRRKPTQDRSRATVDAILEAATYVLSEHGYGKTTTNRIAARAGVNIASLYQYFPSKDAILAELLRRHARQMRSRTLRALRSATSRRALVRVLIEELIDEHRERPMLHRELVEHGARLELGKLQTDVDAELKRERARLLAPWSEADLPAWVATTAAHALVHAALVDRPDALASGALTEELVALLDGYLGKRRRAQRA